MRWRWFGRRPPVTGLSIGAPSGSSAAPPSAVPVRNRRCEGHAHLKNTGPDQLEHSCPGEAPPDPGLRRVHLQTPPTRTWPADTVEEQRELARSACDAACLTEEQTGSYYFEHYSLLDDSPAVRVDQYGRAWFLASAVAWGTSGRLWVHSDDGTRLMNA